ncbi:MAG: hypothetical protein ACOCV4_01545 [Myxococcota bacterium]
MNRLTNLFLASLLVALVLPDQASAQGVRLDRYSAPMTADDGLQVNRPIALGHQRYSASLSLDYANDPLVLRLDQGGSEDQVARLVDHQLVGQMRFAYGLFDRLVVGAGLDVVLAMKGEAYEPPSSGMRLDAADGAGMGDLRLSARYVPFGDRDSLGQVAVQAHLILPTAELGPSQNWRGESGVAFAPELLAEVRPSWVRVTANVGAVVRKDAQFLGTDLGDEVTFGLGVGVPLPFLPAPVELMAEVFGSTRMGDFFGGRSTPVESLFGARWTPAEAWRVSLGAGPGLQAGIGAPDVRALARVAYVKPAPSSTPTSAEPPGAEPVAEEPAPEPAPEPEPEPAPEPEPDADGDGVTDAEDACPASPGSATDDGCPGLSFGSEGGAGVPAGHGSDADDMVAGGRVEYPAACRVQDAWTSDGTGFAAD